MNWEFFAGAMFAGLLLLAILAAYLWRHMRGRP